MRDALLDTVMGQLQLVLEHDHPRLGRGHRPRSHAKRNVYAIRYLRSRGIFPPNVGPSVEHRVKLAIARGGSGKAAYLRIREERRTLEVATLDLLQHLLGRARELLGDTEPPMAYGELIRRAEARLAHPTPCLTGLSEDHRRKISEGLRKGRVKKNRTRKTREDETDAAKEE